MADEHDPQNSVGDQSGFSSSPSGPVAVDVLLIGVDDVERPGLIEPGERPRAARPRAARRRGRASPRTLPLRFRDRRVRRCEIPPLTSTDDPNAWVLRPDPIEPAGEALVVEPSSTMTSSQFVYVWRSTDATASSRRPVGVLNVGSTIEMSGRSTRTFDHASPCRAAHASAVATIAVSRSGGERSVSPSSSRKAGWRPTEVSRRSSGLIEIGRSGMRASCLDGRVRVRSARSLERSRTSRRIPTPTRLVERVKPRSGAVIRQDSEPRTD